MNQIILVGRVKEKPEIRETVSGTKIGNLLLVVERNYKNPEGGFDSDVFSVTLWKSLADECAERIEPGMAIGVKGRLSANNYMKDNETRYRCEIIAEKISLYQAGA